jgi:hypothetical protein
MGILARLFGRRVERERGMLADEQPEAGETPHLPKPRATRGTQPLEMPHETPTTRRLANPGATAGTRTYGAPGGTPSTQRIHNPTRPAGR